MHLIIKYYILAIIIFLQINDTIVNFNANILSLIFNLFLKIII
jgi:hypothetical protein